ncbi:MAG TPA: DUF2726 domain-containing protein [Nitrosomonas mobilis]|nr:DUF2726 domain-containing protein [Nitrosomonas mobilis]
MKAILLAVIVIVAAVLFLTLVKSKGGSRKFPYQSLKFLLSKAERSFYGVLVQAIGNSGLVFSKVRVADVITPKKGFNGSDRQRAFNAISSKHFDFVICDPDDCSLRLAIELDDSSHGSAKAEKRDNLLSGACESAGLPLLRIKAAKGYVVADLRRQVEEAITPPKDTHKPIAIAQDGVSEPTAQVPLTLEEPRSILAPEQGSDSEKMSSSPTCPKCGEPMLRRKAKSGNNVGQEFWGCSAFPKCRAVVR